VRVSVIISTYNQSAWLEKSLWGYGFQTHPDFELVVADDGSGAGTAVMLERVVRELGLRITHVWHEDRGFRKCEILNRAILASSGEYLVFSDGDCIPRSDFVETHVKLAAPDRFLSGGYLRLPTDISRAITLDDVRSGRFAELAWLRRHGWKPGRRAVRLLASESVASLLDRLTTTRATWNGYNASTWRDAVLAVNGFEAEMKYGGEDRAFGERLINLGWKGVQVRHRAPVLHLDHGRPLVRPEDVRRNREIRERIAREGETRAVSGLQEVDAITEPAVTRRVGVS
jgi:glycosyltransferase involved in cell wall biosynthesis